MLNILRYLFFISLVIYMAGFVMLANIVNTLRYEFVFSNMDATSVFMSAAFIGIGGSAFSVIWILKAQYEGKMK